MRTHSELSVDQNEKPVLLETCKFSKYVFMVMDQVREKWSKMRETPIEREPNNM